MPSAAAGDAKATRRYKELTEAAASAAEDAVMQETIPLGARFLIKRYFDAIRARGHDATHLQLGGVPSMRAPEVERDLELLFLGGSTPRRAAMLAPLAPLLWDRDVQLHLFRFSAPVDGASPGTVFGDGKYRLLARSQILLNLHRDDVAPGTHGEREG